MMKEIRVIQTCWDTQDRLTEKQRIIFKADKPAQDGQESNILNVYDQVSYQTVLGFGGAFTEASAINYYGLPDELRQQVLEAYFDRKKGIGYNFCRTTINSCDFSAGIYSYDDEEGDFELEHFSIDHDREAMIPMMKEATKVSEELFIFASPWSPPAWMKTNGRMDKGGYLKKECRDVWARYITRYIKEYEKEGIKLWGVTVQNEAKAMQGWESCVYSGEEERDFVTGYLRPAFERMGAGGCKILFWDHNKERVVDRSLITLCNPRSRDAFDGVGVHWYSGDHFKALSIVHDLFPEKGLFATEACTGRNSKLPYEAGERYAHDMMGDLNNWVCAWTDWNLLLDEEGGPDHWKDEQTENGWEPKSIWVGESPIAVNKKKHCLDFSSSYYYIGHFSKYIRRGAKRIGCTLYTSELEACAFLNPGGEMAVVLLNRTAGEWPVTLRYREELADFISPPHSIITLVFS